MENSKTSDRVAKLYLVSISSIYNLIFPNQWFISLRCYDIFYGACMFLYSTHVCGSIAFGVVKNARGCSISFQILHCINKVFPTAIFAFRSGLVDNILFTEHLIKSRVLYFYGFRIVAFGGVMLFKGGTPVCALIFISQRL